jgi:hypothetical protein
MNGGAIPPLSHVSSWHSALLSTETILPLAYTSTPEATSVTTKNNVIKYN